MQDTLGNYVATMADDVGCRGKTLRTFGKDAALEQSQQVSLFQQECKEWSHLEPSKGNNSLERAIIKTSDFQCSASGVPSGALGWALPENPPEDPPVWANPGIFSTRGRNSASIRC